MAPKKYLLWLVSTGMVANRLCESPDLGRHITGRGIPPFPRTPRAPRGACSRLGQLTRQDAASHHTLPRKLTTTAHARVALIRS